MTAFKPTTKVMADLMDLFDKNQQFWTDFNESFTLARSVPLSEWDVLKINDVNDYLRYMEEYLHWVPIENGSATKNGTNVYMHICMFYFVIDMPPVLKYQNAIDPNTKAPYLQLSEWLIEYAKEMGRWMDTTNSFNKDTLKTFEDSYNYRMQDYKYDDWKTFNEFFARRIKDELRPLPNPDSDNIIVAPADAKYDGQWPVSEASTVEFSVKGVPWHISQLLYDETTGKDWAPHFAGGTFTHSFLAPDNYHRQHAPVSGKIVEAKVVPGLCYLEVVLKQDENKHGGTPRLGMHRHIRSKREHHIVGHVVPPPVRSTPDGADLDAPDSPGYQFLQARGLVMIESAIGLVAVLPIGMAQVSSVVLSDKVKKAMAPGATEADKWINKGEEISKFQLGGSDIVMVFQKDAKVQLPGDDKINSPYKVRSAFGTGTVINDIKPPH